MSNDILLNGASPMKFNEGINAGKQKNKKAIPLTLPKSQIRLTISSKTKEKVEVLE